MSLTDQLALGNLIESISTDSKDLQELLSSRLSKEPALTEIIESEDESHLLVDSFSVLIDCKDESEQVALLKRLKKRGSNVARGYRKGISDNPQSPCDSAGRNVWRSC